MKQKILDRFAANKKWKDYISFKRFECKAALLATLSLLIFSMYIDIYDNFNNYIIAFQNLTIYIVQALLGLLGIILAGVAIIISVFNKNTLKKIKEIGEDKDFINKILISFEFLAFNTGIGILLFLIMHLSLYSQIQLVGKFNLYLIFSVLTYFLFFVIFYAISLIGNTIRLYYISNLYNDIETVEKSVYIKANEMRIDFILNTIIADANITREEFIESLNAYVEASNIENKDEIKEYFKKYY
ncbi:hypothetical protein [Gracilibacillus suaedae]|uniref:hypothetical protein n=1 Tax=Gracilibacillus suaedae TaxID=2820273 RepID=UPI001ABEBF37|nr:hypothetical protein [Gracilibacillus suaedae]